MKYINRLIKLETNTVYYTSGDHGGNKNWWVFCPLQDGANENVFRYLFAIYSSLGTTWIRPLITFFLYLHLTS